MDDKINNLFKAIQAAFYNAKDIKITLTLPKEDINLISDSIYKEALNEGKLLVNEENRFVDIDYMFKAYQTPFGTIKFEEDGKQIPEIPKTPVPLPI